LGIFSISFQIPIPGLLDPPRFTTAPSKQPSPQTQFILDKMGEAAISTEASFAELCANLDLLHGSVARIDTAQQYMAAQVGLISTAIQDSSKLHDTAARHFASLDHRLTELA
jgi:hypothetical protein